MHSMIRLCNPEIDNEMIDKNAINMGPNEIMEDTGYIIYEFSDDKLSMTVNYISKRYFLDNLDKYKHYRRCE